MMDKISICLLIGLLLLLLIAYCKREHFATKPKYFRELRGYPHLDARYGKRGLDKSQIRATLVYLLNQFMRYSRSLGIRPILMYGCLIGYYFNQEMLPWDDDIDMILTEPDFHKLRKFETGDILIEVNDTNKTDFSESDTNNRISARVISKANGVFIDILFHKDLAGDGILRCKDGNHYKTRDILPLKTGIFEGIRVYLPNKIPECLIQRYGKRVLTPLDNMGYKFIGRKGWVPYQKPSSNYF